MSEQQHWTSNFVLESVDPHTSKTVYNFYNENGELIGTRDNKLMAQIALMDYAAVCIDTYTENPVNYFISLKKLINSYDNRYDAMIQTGDTINAETNVRPKV